MTLIIAKIIYYTLLAICAFPIFMIVILTMGWAITEDEKANCYGENIFWDNEKKKCYKIRYY